MLDIRGRVAETPHSNIFIVRGGRLLTPPLENVLAGVSRATALELAARLGIPRCGGTHDSARRDERRGSLHHQHGLQPLTRVEPGRAENRRGTPRPITRRLTDAWCKMIEFDFVAQARELAGK